jgi:hypothetical protein
MQKQNPYTNACNNVVIALQQQGKQRRHFAIEETDDAKMHSSMHLLNSNCRCHSVSLEAAAPICHWSFAARSELPVLWVRRPAVGVACSQARRQGPHLEPHQAHLSRSPAAMAARSLMPPPVRLGRGWPPAHRRGTQPPNWQWRRSRDTWSQIHGGLGVRH